MPERFGLITPVLAGTPPEIHNEWENRATWQDVVEIVKAADRLGYDHIQCSEHVIVAAELEALFGGRYFDPLATFGYLSAVTRRIRFVTSVLVLGYNHPLAIAKRYGTLDVVSGGRLVLGLGVGGQKPEFDVLGVGGVEFEERGARGDDAIRALRASLGRRVAEYHGRYYDFGKMIVEPHAVQSDMRLWIGGCSFRSLRRAVELGDGWMPFGFNAQELAAQIARAKELPSYAERTRALELILNADKRLDPIGAPGGTVEVLRALFAAGATLTQLALEAGSSAHYIEQLEAMANLAQQVFA